MRTLGKIRDGWLVIVLVGLSALACSSSKETSRVAGISGESCQVHDDCGAGLSCVHQVCVTGTGGQQDKKDGGVAPSSASLGVRGFARLRLIEWPLLRAPLGLALATVIAFSIGDLGVAALFGMGDAVTLPLYVYSLMGAYRMDQGGAAALLLCALILLLFLCIERGFRGRSGHG